MTLWK